MPVRALAVHAEPMVNGVPLIDLDRLPSAPVEPPAGARLRPAALVAAVILLLTLGGAAPGAPGLTPVLTLTAPVTAFRLAGAALFLGTTTEVRRYDLPAGTARWTRAFSSDVQDVRYDETTGVVIAVASRDPRLTALEAGSGRVLWTADGADSVVISTSRGGVLTETNFTGPAQLRLADARTGRLVWTREVDPSGFLGPDGLYEDGSAQVVVVGSGGDVTVLRYSDGAVLGRGDMGLGAEPGTDRSILANSVVLSVVGERIYLSRRLRGKTTLTAFSVPPLTRLWEADGGPLGLVNDCGRVICVADTRFVTGVDAADGAVRWTQPAWSSAFRYDADRLFAYDNQEDTGAALLDAATGRVLRDLGHSRNLGGLVLRTEGRQTFVSVPEPGTANLRTVGVMRDVAWFRCAGQGGYLVCPTLAGETSLWRVS